MTDNGTIWALTSQDGIATTTQINTDITSEKLKERWPFFFLILFILISVFINVLVILSVFFYDKLHQVFYYGIASMSLGHIINLLLFVPILIARTLLEDFPFATSLCHAWETIGAIVSAMSVVHLCMLTYLCQTMLIHPLKYKRWNSAKKALIIVICCWSLSICLSFPSIIFWPRAQQYDISVGKDPSVWQPVLMYGCGLLESSYIYAMIVPCYGAGIVCFTGLYYRLIIAIKYQGLIVRKLKSPPRSPGASKPCTPSSSHGEMPNGLHTGNQSQTSKQQNGIVLNVKDTSNIEASDIVIHENSRNNVDSLDISNNTDEINKQNDLAIADEASVVPWQQSQYGNEETVRYNISDDSVDINKLNADEGTPTYAKVIKPNRSRREPDGQSADSDKTLAHMVTIDPDECDPDIQKHFSRDRPDGQSNRSSKIKLQSAVVTSEIGSQVQQLSIVGTDNTNIPYDHNSTDVKINENVDNNVNENMENSLEEQFMYDDNINNIGQNSDYESLHFNDDDDDNDLNQIRSNGDDNKIGITNCDDNGKDFTNCDDNGKDFTNCDDNGKDITNCDENGKDFTNCDENGKDITNCDENGKDITNCDENGKDITKCDENGKDITNCEGSKKDNNISEITSGDKSNVNDAYFCQDITDMPPPPPILNNTQLQSHSNCVEQPLHNTQKSHSNWLEQPLHNTNNISDNKEQVNNDQHDGEVNDCTQLLSNDFSSSSFDAGLDNPSYQPDVESIKSSDITTPSEERESKPIEAETKYNTNEESCGNIKNVYNNIVVDSEGASVIPDEVSAIEGGHPPDLDTSDEISANGVDAVLNSVTPINVADSIAVNASCVTTPEYSMKSETNDSVAPLTSEAIEKRQNVNVCTNEMDDSVNSVLNEMVHDISHEEETISNKTEDGNSNPTGSTTDKILATDSNLVENINEKNSAPEHTSPEGASTTDDINQEAEECNIKSNRPTILKKKAGVTEIVRVASTKSVTFSEHIQQTDIERNTDKKRRPNNRPPLKLITNNSASSEASTGSAEYMARVNLSQGERIQTRIRSHKMTVTMLLVMYMLYVVLTIPYNMYLVFIAINRQNKEPVSEKSQQLLMILQWVATTATLINPIVCWLMSDDFKQGNKETYLSCCDRDQKYYRDRQKKFGMLKTP